MPEIDMRNLALALVQAVQMWSNPRYKSFLLCAKPGELTDEWFRWFVGAWNVARTIKDGRQARVREYLDRDFRRALLAGGDAETVDARSTSSNRAGVHDDARMEKGLSQSHWFQRLDSSSARRSSCHWIATQWKG